MSKLFKILIFKIICFLFLFQFISCNKESDILIGEEKVSFLKSSLPEGKLSSKGGTVDIQVIWEFTEWKIEAGDNLEGQKFITIASPAKGGSNEQGKSKTVISVHYSSNPSVLVNKQEVILSSIDGVIKNTIILEQESSPANMVELKIDPNVSYQTISGFGACNGVFRGVSNYPKNTDMQKAYGNGDDELGLSIFRVSIPPEKIKWEPVAKVAFEAYNRGAKVIATPWNAPEELIDPDKDKPVILPSKYDDYVKHLNEFNTFMSNNGVELYAISVQNEPDIGEWTQWSQEQVFNFMKYHAGSINNSRVITPESFNFNLTYYNNLLVDPICRDNFEIVGGHIYGNGLRKIPLAEQYGKEIWMTEYLLNEHSGEYSNSGIAWEELTEKQIWDQSLEMLCTIHDAMTHNWNAYVWWYLKRYYSFIGDGLEGSKDGEILKRGYAFSHYSKFVKPEFLRIKAEVDSLSKLKVTAYQGNEKTVLVIINSGEFPYGLKLSDLNTNQPVVSYETSIYKNREKNTIALENGQLEKYIDGKSVLTLIVNNQ